jgi:hypothetical protein
VRSFTVPYTDHQIDVDAETGRVLVYLNAWNRESCGTADRIYTYSALQADRALLASLAAMLPGAEGAELERLVMTGS